MDVISRLDCRLRQSLEHTVCMVLFKIFLTRCFLSVGRVDSAFYLICPKHTSLIFPAGSVRGSVSLPPHRGFRFGFFYRRCSPRGRPAEGSIRSTASPPTATAARFLFFTPAPTRPSLLTYIFINSLEEVRRRKEKKRKTQQAENETIMGPRGVLLFVLTQRTSYAN